MSRLTTDAANMIFKHAKARVHQVQPKAKAKVSFSQNPRTSTACGAALILFAN